jgi:hypothetical protein
MRRQLAVLITLIGGLAALAACLVVAIQFIPTGVSTENPPVVAEPAWDSAQTRALAARACFDCHSNETRWPWYARIAPASWLTAHDVAEGRRALNFSEWGVARPGADGGDEEAGEHEGGEDESGEALEHISQVLQHGEMPPASYTLLHPDARLTRFEVQQLLEGFYKSLQ